MANRTSKPAYADLALRTLTNMLKCVPFRELLHLCARSWYRGASNVCCLVAVFYCSRRGLAKVMGAKYETVLDGLVGISAHQDVKVRLAFVGLLVNYSILFKEE